MVLMTMSRDCLDPERRKKVGHYILGPCLGEGTFSKVRIGTHVISREKVAVKVVSKRVIIRREAARRNFRREALLLQHVCHPNVVRLFEAMETPNSYYLVFELAGNGHLLSYVTERKCLEEAEGRHFMRQIVSAVDHLHRSGIIHRDLRLENFLLNVHWDIKIIDFGLSALCQREGGLHTQCGSPVYTAPEIFGNRRYGPAVDLWSIGVCLYAMVVGRLPFMPDPPTDMPQLHALILKGVVIPGFLSSGLQHLLSGLLEVQESRRLSICDLLQQSWLTCNRNQPIARYPPVSKAPPPVVDTNVVRYMTTMFRFSESDVIHSVTERKLNASSSTYHLLKRHMEGQCSSAAGERSAARGESRDSRVTEFSEVVSGCPVLRAHILPPGGERGSQEERGDSGGGVEGAAKVEAGAGRVASSYKQCILYLKEARGGFGLTGRSLTHLQRDAVTGDSVAPRKLPLLNAHRHSVPPAYPLSNLHPHPHHHHHGAGAPPALPHASQQCHDGARHFVQPLPNHDLRLNVMGRPALKGRDGGAGRGPEDRGQGRGQVGDPAAGSSAFSNSSSSSKHAPAAAPAVADSSKPLPPPAPPNTAQGARVTLEQSAGSSEHQRESGSRPSSASWPRSDSSPLDPFGRDTWRAGLKLEGLRLAGEDEARQHRKSGGVAFIAPLSSPKALTNRAETVAGRRRSYFLVRHLAADLNRKRNHLANKKNTLMSRSLPAPHVSDSNDDHSEDDDNSSRASTANGPFSDSLDKERFMTPVISVTITSTVKE